jgi:hypothetical protein
MGSPKPAQFSLWLPLFTNRHPFHYLSFVCRFEKVSCFPLSGIIATSETVAGTNRVAFCSQAPKVLTLSGLVLPKNGDKLVKKGHGVLKKF